jgi:hypothetical protein
MPARHRDFVRAVTYLRGRRSTRHAPCTVVYPLIERLDAAGVPVVVVTAYSFAGEITANLKAVLSKPVEKDALIEAVCAALRRAPAAAGRTRPPRDGCHRLFVPILF